ncbi:YceI-like domain protein [compost metagenome]
MKKILLIVGVLSLAAAELKAQSQLIARNAELSFYSSAPIEDIKASSKSGYSVMDTQAKTVYFKVDMRTFKFRKGLMEEHFNENYIESDRYPYAEYKGKIVDDVDLSKDGDYQVTVKGDLLLHNVTQNYTTKADIKVRDGRVSASSSFKVKLADHKIKIPTLLVKNIAEVVDVSVSVVYADANKKI